MIQQLETDNYLLRPLGLYDVTERYLSWLRDPDVNRTLDVGGEMQTMDTLRQYIESHDGETRILFGIFTRKGLHIGTHSFRHYPRHRLVTIGIMIGGKDYWGKKVPLETRACLLDYAFDVLQCDKAEAGCYSINLPAIYNFKAQHWSVEGVQRSHRLVGGKPVDMILFGMLKKEWHAYRETTRQNRSGSGTQRAG